MGKKLFDYVIGNPPYIRPHHLSSEVKNVLWREYPTFEKKAIEHMVRLTLALLKEEA